MPEAEPLSYEGLILHRSGPSTGLTALIPILRWNRRANGSYVTQRSTGTGFLIGKLDDYGDLVDGKDPLDWICDAEKMYGILEGKLVCFDYLSRKMTVLYEQDGEVILPSDLRYQRECLFFVAGENPRRASPFTACTCRTARWMR